MQRNPMSQLSRPFLPSNIPPKTGNTQQSPVSFAQCGRCRLYHASTFSCPALRTSTQISMALDDIKLLSGGDPVAKQLNKGILQQILRHSKDGRQAGQNSSSPAATPQLAQAPLPPQQRTVLPSQPKPALPKVAPQMAPKPLPPQPQMVPKPAPQQPQPSAAAEEDSGETSTDSDGEESEAESEEGSEAGSEEGSGEGSDSGSEAESEAGPGSSGSESGEDVMAAILSR